MFGVRCSVFGVGSVNLRAEPSSNMASNKEIEIKFRVPDTGSLARRLRAAKFRVVTPRTHEMNTLYDLPGEVLRKRKELLRLRQYGSEWTLTHKAKKQSGRHSSREELETSVGDGKQMDAILRALGYSPFFRYEKFRAEWSDGKGQVVVDETPIDNFCEIEGAPRWIDPCLSVIGVLASAPFRAVGRLANLADVSVVQ